MQKTYVERLSLAVQEGKSFLSPQARVSWAMYILYCVWHINGRNRTSSRLDLVNETFLIYICGLLRTIGGARKEAESEWFAEKHRYSFACSPSYQLSLQYIQAAADVLARSQREDFHPFDLLRWLAEKIKYHPAIIALLPLCGALESSGRDSSSQSVSITDYTQTAWWFPERWLDIFSKASSFPLW